MAERSTHHPVIPISVHRKKLRQLYARRYAIISLIRSLEDYERFRSCHARPKELKTA